MPCAPAGLVYLVRALGPASRVPQGHRPPRVLRASLPGARLAGAGPIWQHRTGASSTGQALAKLGAPGGLIPVLRPVPCGVSGPGPGCQSVARDVMAFGGVQSTEARVDGHGVEATLILQQEGRGPHHLLSCSCCSSPQNAGLPGLDRQDHASALAAWCVPSPCPWASFPG